MGQRSTPLWATTMGKGTTLGTPRIGAWSSPPPPTPPPLDAIKRPTHLTSTRTTIEAAVEQMLAAYDRNLQARPRPPQLTDHQWAAYSIAVLLVINARASIDAYVTFAMQHMRILRGRTPYRNEVISPRAVASWLPQYLGRSGEVLTPMTYQATPERRRLWRDWIARARTLNRTLSI